MYGLFFFVVLSPFRERENSINAGWTSTESIQQGQRWVQLKVGATLQRPSISGVSEPRAVATGSYAHLRKKLHFAGHCVIRSLPLAVLTRLVATLTFNYTRQRAQPKDHFGVSEGQRLGGDAELLGILRDDADGQEAEDEIVGLIADDLMIVQVPDGADCAGAVVYSTGESGDLRL